MKKPPETYERLVSRLGGRTEDDRTEFKAADAIAEGAGLEERIEKLLREIVGFLNGRGGELFLGIGETEGRASSFEGVAEPASKVSRLRDVFLDRIKPRASIEIDSISVPGTDRAIVRIGVPRGKAGVYAFSSGAKFCVYERFHDRLRQMTWDQVLEKARDSSSETESTRLMKARSDISNWMEEVERRHRGKGIWLFAAEPAHEGSKSAPDDDTKEAIQKAVQDPSLSKNRKMGWTFEVSGDSRPIQGGMESGRGPEASGGAYRHLRFYWTGRMRFVTALDSFEWGTAKRERASLHRTQEEGWVLYPYCVVEYPLSLIRLVSFLLDTPLGLDEATPVLLQTAFLEARGSILLPGRPENPMFGLGEARPYPERSLYSPLDPLRVTLKELVENPDQVAHRLISDTYEAFGHGRSAIPFFDASTRRFHLSS